jgi:N-acetylmuramoyl-L-alanine amidase
LTLSGSLAYDHETKNESRNAGKLMKRSWILLFSVIAFLMVSPAWLAAGDATVAGGPVRMVVDPGHGGKDHGTRSPGGLLEKDVALMLARELRDEARSLGGFQIVLSREEDETFAWPRRREAGAGADVWVSVHLNADAEGKARGPRIYYPQVVNGDEASGNGNRSKTRNGSEVGAILQDMTRTKRGNEGVLMAEHLQRALEAAWGVGSRPSQAAPLFGLSDLDCPAVLVEVGFLTNQADLRGLEDSNRRKQLAKAILRGIRSFVQDPRRAE